MTTDPASPEGYGRTGYTDEHGFVPSAPHPSNLNIPSFHSSRAPARLCISSRSLRESIPGFSMLVSGCSMLVRDHGSSLLIVPFFASIALFVVNPSPSPQFLIPNWRAPARLSPIPITVGKSSAKPEFRNPPLPAPPVSGKGFWSVSGQEDRAPFLRPIQWRSACP